MPLYTTYLDRKLDFDARSALKDTTYLAPVQNEDVDTYLSEMRRILESPPTYGVPPEPSLIYDNVYLGTAANAEDIRLLRRNNIKYILNCAGIPVIRYERETRYRPEHGIEGYEEISAEDGETYDISRHFLKAHQFIDHARARGRVLIYCPDVNRSGAIALSYLVRKGTSLLKATKQLKQSRKVALLNRGFMKHLIVFARDRGLLKREQTHLQARQYEGITRVRDRNLESHLLHFL